MPDFLSQPTDAEGPVFNEPWEAQAFGLVLALHQRGFFEWSEWAEYLAKAITRAQEAGDADLGDSYYQHWLAALETLANDKGFTAVDELARRKLRWESAYLNTPHGQPISLAAAATHDRGEREPE